MSTQTLQQLQHLSVISKVTAGEVLLPPYISLCTADYMRAHAAGRANSSTALRRWLLLLLVLLLLVLHPAPACSCGPGSNEQAF